MSGAVSGAEMTLKGIGLFLLVAGVSFVFFYLLILWIYGLIDARRDRRRMAAIAAALRREEQRNG